MGKRCRGHGEIRSKSQLGAGKPRSQSVVWSVREVGCRILKGGSTLRRFLTMSANEILDELPKLTPGERLRIYQQIAQMEHLDEIEPTPELNAAIEEGLRSLETEPVVPLEEVSEKIRQWAGVSS